MIQSIQSKLLIVAPDPKIVSISVPGPSKVYKFCLLIQYMFFFIVATDPIIFSVQDSINKKIYKKFGPWFLFRSSQWHVRHKAGQLNHVLSCIVWIGWFITRLRTRIIDKWDPYSKPFLFLWPWLSFLGSGEGKWENVFI